MKMPSCSLPARKLVFVESTVHKFDTIQFQEKTMNFRIISIIHLEYLLRFNLGFAVNMLYHNVLTYRTL